MPTPQTQGSALIHHPRIASSGPMQPLKSMHACTTLGRILSARAAVFEQSSRALDPSQRASTLALTCAGSPRTQGRGSQQAPTTTTHRLWLRQAQEPGIASGRTVKLGEDAVKHCGEWLVTKSRWRGNGSSKAVEESFSANSDQTGEGELEREGDSTHAASRRSSAAWQQWHGSSSPR